MERIRVWAVGDRLYPHAAGHVGGRECRFVGRTHVRLETKTDRARFPHADSHRAEFPVRPEGDELLVGTLADGADIGPSELYLAILHGDLTDKDPNVVETAPVPEPPAPKPSGPVVLFTDANIAGGQTIKRTAPTE